MGAINRRVFMLWLHRYIYRERKHQRGYGYAVHVSSFHGSPHGFLVQTRTKKTIHIPDSCTSPSPLPPPKSSPWQEYR